METEAGVSGGRRREEEEGGREEGSFCNGVKTHVPFANRVRFISSANGMEINPKLIGFIQFHAALGGGVYTHARRRSRPVQSNLNLLLSYRIRLPGGGIGVLREIIHLPSIKRLVMERGGAHSAAIDTVVVGVGRRRCRRRSRRVRGEGPVGRATAQCRDGAEIQRQIAVG